MFRLISLLFFSGLTVCASIVSSEDSLQAPEAKSAPQTAQRSHMRLALPRREYLCEGGARVVVLLQTNAVRLTLNEHIYNMKQVEAASGAKYSEGSVVWTINGDNGILEDDSVAGQPQILAKACHLQSSYPLVAPAAGVVTGTLSYSKRYKLPPGAVVIVELQDVFLQDAPSPTVAKYEGPLGKGQQPIHFTLKFDPSKIDPKHPYAVEARILVGDQLRVTNDKQYLVLTLGHPANVEMELVGTAPMPTKP